MEIIRARVLGYCMGVRRAVESAVNALESNTHTEHKKRIFTLGPLIHNPSVLQELSGRGLQVLDASKLTQMSDAGTESTDGAVVIIRAHGTTPDVIASLESLHARIIDATCPRVHLSQKRAEEWSSKGYSIIIAGDKNHGEVTSISGFAAKGNGGADCVTVVQSGEEVSALDIPAKTVLLAQTTFSPMEFEHIAAILRQKNPDVIICNSICPATMDRQNALRELAGTVDGILVVGGKNSANTRRLYETAFDLSAHAALIEDDTQIPQDFFALQRVGITAGASTPDAVIEAVERRLLLLQK